MDVPSTIEGIQRHLEIMQRRLEELSQAKATEQRFLDMDTTEKVVSRVMKWTKAALFCRNFCRNSALNTCHRPRKKPVGLTRSGDDRS
jgi:hypothetical protein